MVDKGRRSRKFCQEREREDSKMRRRIPFPFSFISTPSPLLKYHLYLYHTHLYYSHIFLLLAFLCFFLDQIVMVFSGVSRNS